MALLSILRFSELSNQHMLNAGKGDIHSKILLLNKHAVSSLCTVCFHFDFFGEYILFLKVLDHRDFSVFKQKLLNCAYMDTGCVVIGI